MKYALVTGSVAMIYLPSFKDWLGIQIDAGGRIHRQRQDANRISLLYESRLKKELLDVCP
jgi:hypothetical protein